MYVALPGHPLYGRCVSIIRQRTMATATHCLIEDLDHPLFCYQILKRWLSIQPPPLAIPSPATPPAVVIHLARCPRSARPMAEGQAFWPHDEHSP